MSTAINNVTIGRMLQVVREQIDIPDTPRSVRAARRALATVYAATYAKPGKDVVTSIARSESLAQLGPENVARIEAIADAWRLEQPLPIFKTEKPKEPKEPKE